MTRGDHKGQVDEAKEEDGDFSYRVDEDGANDAIQNPSRLCDQGLACGA